MLRITRMLHKAIRYAVVLVLATSLSGCEIALKDLQDLNQEKEKEVVVSTILANRLGLSRAITDGLEESEGNSRSETADGGSFTENEFEEYLADPERLVDEMLAEAQGAEALHFLYTAITSTNPDDLMEAAQPLIGENEILRFEIDTRSLIRGLDDEVAARGYVYEPGKDDKVLHLLTGAAVATLVSAIVFICAKWFQPSVKAGALIAVSLCTGVLFGLAKEIHDDFDPNNGFDFEDWMVTAMGSIQGSIWSVALANIVYTVFSSRILTCVFTSVAGLWLLYEGESVQWLWSRIVRLAGR